MNPRAAYPSYRACGVLYGALNVYPLLGILGTQETGGGDGREDMTIFQQILKG